MNTMRLDSSNTLTLYRRGDKDLVNPTLAFIRDEELIGSVEPKILVKIAIMAGGEMAYNNKDVEDTK